MARYIGEGRSIASHAKVRNLGDYVDVEKHIEGFDISMHVTKLVHELQALLCRVRKVK